jgi:hypothetical protein
MSDELADGLVVTNPDADATATVVLELVASGEDEPTMMQAIPVDAFADDYAFVTPDGFDLNFVQVVRRRGGARVGLDGDDVTGFETVTEGFEVAEVEIGPGPHRIRGDDAFGVVQTGFTDNRVNTGCSDAGRPGTCFSSYAHAAGIRAVVR